MKADLVADTNVLSFLFRQDSRAEAYLPYLENKAIAISFQTLAELELWALSRRAKLGISCRVKVPVGQGLATHPYRVLGPWRSRRKVATRRAKRRQRIP